MTKIEWTDVTWNPVTGCDKVSQGCKNCYAERMHKRLLGIAPHKYTKPFLHNIELHVEEVYAPLFWKKPRVVFVNSMSDLLHKDVPFAFIDAVFDCMSLAHWHTFQVLTKRAERLVEYYKWKIEGNGFQFRWPLPNVWLGVSCEDQQQVDERIPNLLQVPAAIRFLSCEPLLGELDIEKYSLGVDWVITGGESGPHARPVHPSWVRSLRDQCQRNVIPFFFKQWGEYAPVEALNIEALLPESDAPIKGKFYPSINFSGASLAKVGKSKAGNMLDGKQHLQIPTNLF